MFHGHKKQEIIAGYTLHILILAALECRRRDDVFEINDNIHRCKFACYL